MQTVMSDDKIINGALATNGQFPFLIQLFNKTGNYNFCGGSLIGPYHVLTAAHCTVDAIASEIQIWAGSLDIYDDVKGYKVDVAAIHVNPNYDANLIRNDVTVIKLAKPFPKTVGVRTVQLPTTSAAPGALLTVCGFGATVPAGGTYPEFLMFVQIPMIKTAECQNYFGSSIVASQMICGFDTNPNQGTCYGDSGGPIVTGSKTTAVQQGVVSFGSANGCATTPSVFARVSYFRDWILQQTVHTVVTACASCAVDTHWKGLCQQMGGVWALTATNYQCKNLNIDKTRTVDYSWGDCTNTKVKDLCNQVGRYACSGGVGTCSVL